MFRAALSRFCNSPLVLLQPRLAPGLRLRQPAARQHLSSKRCDFPRLDDPERAILLVCDIQERFRGLIWGGESVINRAALVRSVCRLLKIPVLATEQNPAAFGLTVPELQVKDADDTSVFHKTSFSMLGSKGLVDELNKSKRTKIILVGIEAHACCLQTVLDLGQTNRGADRPAFETFVICDAVSSQRAHDRTVALNRMQSVGAATLCTAESAIFELVGDASHPRFREASSLIKAANARCASTPF